MTANAGITWEADDRAVQAAHNRMVKQVADLKEQLRLLKSESTNSVEALKRKFDEATKRIDGTRASAQGLRGSLTEVGRSVAGMIAPLLTVEAGLASARNITQQWVQHTERLIELRAKLEETTVATAAPSGIPGERIEGWLRQPSDATRSQRLEALSQVSQVAPDLTDMRKMEIAGVTARHGVRGLDTMRKLSRTAADVANILPDRSAGDVVDAAARLQTLLGDKTDQLGSDAFQRGIADLQATGMSGEDSLAHAVAALRGDQRGEVLGKLAKGEGTAKRWFKRQYVPSISGEISRAMRDDYEQAQLDDLQDYEAGRSAIAERMVTASEEDATQSDRSTRAQQISRVNRFIRNKAAEQGPLAYAGALQLSAQNWFSHYDPTRLEPADPTGALRGARQMGIVSADEVKQYEAQERLIAEMQRLNANMERANGQRSTASIHEHTE